MIRPLLSALARTLYPENAVRSVLRGPARGTRFQVVSGMGVTYALGFPNWNLGFLSRHLRPGMTIYDVGANCGQMALFFSRATGPSGRVLAFEPVSANVAILRANLERNPLRNFEVFASAVCADATPRKFYLRAAAHTMGTLRTSTDAPEWWDTVLEVPALTLDSLSGSHVPPDLLKIDVEGGGGEVVDGARQLITETLPLIYFEIHAENENAPELEALKWLRHRLGYSMTCVEFPDADPFQPAWGPAIWCVPPT